MSVELDFEKLMVEIRRNNCALCNKQISKKIDVYYVGGVDYLIKHPWEKGRLVWTPF